ncbi:MAG TPA: hypothetical protein VF062_24725 [Candidatus Limnocylindrales bacterium]
MLAVLGLGGAEEDAYRRLVARSAASPAELAAGTGQPVAAIAQCLATLADRGLAVAGPDGRFTAAPPAVALGTLVRRLRDDLAEAEQDVAALAEQHRSAALALPSGGLVEIITDLSAVRQRFAQLQEAARVQVRSMMVPNISVVPHGANEAGTAGMRRGVRYRVILDRGALAQPGVVPELLASLGEGEDIRIADRVPVKMIIADDECAMLPLLRGQNTAHASVLIHPSAMLDALIAHFELAWALAHTVQTGQSRDAAIQELSPGPLEAIDRRILTLLLAGLTDESVASQLDTSVRTIQRRVHHMIQVAGVKTRVQLGWHAARNGWA